MNKIEIDITSKVNKVGLSMFTEFIQLLDDALQDSIDGNIDLDPSEILLLVSEFMSNTASSTVFNLLGINRERSIASIKEALHQYYKTKNK